MPALQDFKALTNILLIVRANYERGAPVDKSFLRKTAFLVQEQISSGTILKPTDIYALDEPALEKIAASNQPDTVKVFNLLKALHDHIKHMAQQQPWLISIGYRAEAMAQAFEERQKTTHEALEQLQAFITEVQKAEHARKESELSPEAFAVLWYIKREGLPGADAVAYALGEAFVKYPHWHSSTAQERELRRALYKALIDAWADDVVKLATGTLRMLRRATTRESLIASGSGLRRPFPVMCSAPRWTRGLGGSRYDRTRSISDR